MRGVDRPQLLNYIYQKGERSCLFSTTSINTNSLVLPPRDTSPHLDVSDSSCRRTAEFETDSGEDACSRGVYAVDSLR
jgi:hypothetical protein